MAEDIGKLLLRLTLGGLILLHGLGKIAGGVSGISGMLTGIGLPAGLAHGVYLGLGLVHTKDLFVLTKTGGWGIERYAVNRR
jgi:uncharacterized membrane protein YphA (DoxX/SURF4 family)